MRIGARFLSRALIAIAAVTLLVGVLVLGLGFYVGTWPLRRLGRRDEGAGAKLAAIQELAVAVAGAVSAFRARQP